MTRAEVVPRGSTAPPAPPARRSRRRSERGGLLAGLAFLAPFLLVYVAFVIWPVGQALQMSFYDWDLLGYTRDPVGLDNYRRMLWGTGMTWDLAHLAPLRLVLLVGTAAVLVRAARRGARRRTLVGAAAAALLLAALLGIHPSSTGSWNDPVFWTSVRHTVEFTAISTPILVGLGLAMALALHGRGRGARWYQAAFFLPYVLPISAVTLIWTFLLNPDRGLIAGALGAVGLPPINWLSNADLALWAIVLTTVWWTVGFNLVLFLAGLQDIDPHLYEAAALDGAGRWQRFRHVTAPGLTQVTVLVAITQLIASFQVFGQVYIMTRGGPGDATRVVIQHIYEAGFRDLQLGYAAAVSLFLFVVMAIVSAVQFRLVSREA
ncbi:MAG: ABC transporter, permease protein 1 (cluster 1, maltose/g3p/polyamine/iron) [uncultured Pseudonocardia sp.]|uniref:ABC transporter, permease protein 1 (Cluster 1, maltose/g3p/polyamine/iron) n=1 Tax=uncultured Pseudonocardia sp. TaxID=211455 RepID=A0A6J4N4A4_9PSEU|nr:MAG: ABC transporter, permease protein 1 (cluster 1, maltose/g3p/polyamine/iron) [uncultured Pseudonocardia sp.]